MSDKHVTGPIQVFVIGFDHFEATGRIMAELRRARKRGVIRIVDVLFVQKDKHGSIENSMHMTDLSENERMRLGSIAGGLIGLHAGGVEGMIEGEILGALAVAERDAGLSVDRMKELAESIPAGGAAAILVIEHHWAANLRNAIADAGGFALMQAMISPDALALVGDELRVKLEAEEAIEAAEQIKLMAADGHRRDAGRGGAHRGGRHRRGCRCRRHGARHRGCRGRGRDRRAVRRLAHRGGRHGGGRRGRVSGPRRRGVGDRRGGGRRGAVRRGRRGGARGGRGRRRAVRARRGGALEEAEDVAALSAEAEEVALEEAEDVTAMSRVAEEAALEAAEDAQGKG